MILGPQDGEMDLENDITANRPTATIHMPEMDTDTEAEVFVLRQPQSTTILPNYDEALIAHDPQTSLNRESLILHVV
ncbi:hypothetical protein BU17DRAFT_101354 [Hysterangium stoloniferum]|nr:hypothetical protein BU17DRAFT_101354 [Hysterangium stoloniferum]